MSVFTDSLPSDLLKKASSEHRFIRLASEGKLTERQFQTWLNQDYLFVRCLLRLVAHTLTVAPEEDHSLLVQSLVTIDEELKWFAEKTEGQDRPLSANVEYENYLHNLIKTNNDYFQLISVYYAIEICYYEAWKSVKNSDYREYKKRWASNEFKRFINQLRAVVNRTSNAASEEQKRHVRLHWNLIMQYECQFWDMALKEASGN